MPDRAAFVTGASSGIGLAIAHALGEDGHALTVAARRPEKLSQAVEELRAAGHEVEEVAANLTEEDDIRRVVAAHRERFGRLLSTARRSTSSRRPAASTATRSSSTSRRSPARPASPGCRCTR
jgi:NAD(P)-dependent dehydrogenase (short-subunit alcohol dehydrogenase family)